MTNPAILIIDMCEDFFKDGRLFKARQNLCSNINELTRFFRQSGYPVIWVRQEFEPDLSDAFLTMRQEGIYITIKGTDGAKLLPELDTKQSDHEIIKKRYSPFFRTNLDDLLNQLKASTLVLAGVNTHACIRTAAVDGFQRDYEVILAEQTIDSYDLNFHEESTRYLEGRVGRFMSNTAIMKKFIVE